jgi:hypothetical protein
MAHDTAESNACYCCTAVTVAVQAEELRAQLGARLGWSYDIQLLGEDDDEYAPVVVEGL